ncbi:MAG: formate dehydrogenase accessory sulfurtransferase FdhD [Rhodoferax sp.]
MRRGDLIDAMPQAPGMRYVASHRFPGDGAAGTAENCWVVEEQALFVDVAEVGLFTMMWTTTDRHSAAGYLPGCGVLGESHSPEALALCVGFLLTDGLIDSMADLASLAVCDDAPDVVKVVLADPARVRSHRRGGLVASSCGICGSIDRVGSALDALAGVPDTLRLASAQVVALMDSMQSCQTVFRGTGGAHAAALFGPDMRLLASAEDLGRHNALDKVIGQCMLRQQPTGGGCVTLSGRVSLELVVKAARAGVEIVSAVSAPSSLAIDVADRVGITLCGFVRSGRLTAFSHAHRLG